MRTRAALVAFVVALSCCTSPGQRPTEIRRALFAQTPVGSSPEQARAAHDAWEYKCGLPFEDRTRNDASGPGPGDSDPRVVRVLSGCVRSHWIGFGVGGHTRYLYANWLYDASNTLLNITMTERMERVPDPERKDPVSQIPLP